MEPMEHPNRDRKLGLMFRELLASRRPIELPLAMSLLRDLMGEDDSLLPALRLLSSQPTFLRILNTPPQQLGSTQRDALIQTAEQSLSASLVARISPFLDGLTLDPARPAGMPVHLRKPDTEIATTRHDEASTHLADPVHWSDEPVTMLAPENGEYTVLAEESPGRGLPGFVGMSSAHQPPAPPAGGQTLRLGLQIAGSLLVGGLAVTGLVELIQYRPFCELLHRCTPEPAPSKPGKAKAPGSKPVTGGNTIPTRGTAVPSRLGDSSPPARSLAPDSFPSVPRAVEPKPQYTRPVEQNQPPKPIYTPTPPRYVAPAPEPAPPPASPAPDVAPAREEALW